VRSVELVITSFTSTLVVNKQASDQTTRIHHKHNGGIRDDWRQRNRIVSHDNIYIYIASPGLSSAMISVRTSAAR
jgi:hypothetical protein